MPSIPDHAESALRFDTGAPWLDLIATVGNAYGPAPVERMPGLERLTAWLAHESLTPRRGPVAADVARFHELREVLRPLGLAAAAGKVLPGKELERLNEALAGDRPLRLRRARGAAVTLEAPATVTVALARVAADAARTLDGPMAAHLHTCADEACGMLFLDPGGRRHWCSAARCGVRHRVRAHRARRVDEAGQHRPQRTAD